jgi:ABC-type lipoprotein export system ATPase subunit
MSDTRLTSIDVGGLFGREPFEILLDPEAPTVLTGANGTGKSTLLRLISALSNSDVTALATAPLDYLALHFEGIDSLRMTRVEGQDGFALEWGEQTGFVGASLEIGDLPDWAIQLLEDNDFDIPDALKSASDFAVARSISYQEYRRTREVLQRMEGDEAVHIPSWLPEFGESFPVLFVTDQRLVTESRVRRSAPKSSRRTTQLAVEAAGSELAERIRAADSNYARASQERDRLFPRDLMRAMSKGGDVSVKELDTTIALVSAQRERLREVGLLDDGAQYEPEMTDKGLRDPNQRIVMNAVLKATLDKLAVLEGLERRLSAFKAFLDDRFAPKKMELDRDHGMHFVSGSGLSVRPRQLSSGEQQMTVLAYEILFRTKPNTLVIIDEPEISLHVLWQDSLLDDLTAMGRASNLQFLMATHSPTILANHQNLERTLAGVVQ